MGVLDPDAIPDDSDGDALRRLIADGSSLERPMTVDFHVAVSDEPAAREIAHACGNLGYHVRINEDAASEGKASRWTVTCTTRLVLNHQAAGAIQDELYEIARPFGGVPDGWGTFGNARR